MCQHEEMVFMLIIPDDVMAPRILWFDVGGHTERAEHLRAAGKRCCPATSAQTTYMYLYLSKVLNTRTCTFT